MTKLYMILQAREIDRDVAARRLIYKSRENSSFQEQTSKKTERCTDKTQSNDEEGRHADKADFEQRTTGT